VKPPASATGSVGRADQSTVTEGTGESVGCEDGVWLGSGVSPPAHDASIKAAISTVVRRIKLNLLRCGSPGETYNRVVPETEGVIFVALAAVLVTYNNGLNRWPPFHGRLYVPLNLALTAAVTLVGITWGGLDRDGAGLRAGQAGGAAIGLALGLAASIPMFIALRSSRAATRVADERFAGISRAALAYRALVRIPLGTALPEELIFRGVLFGLLLPEGQLQAALWSSLVFGLWHIAPAYNRMEANGRVAGTGRYALAGALAAAVAATGAAGLAFTWLRVATGGIAAPLVLHATVNSLGMIAAHRANRRPGA
jgi:membrane protease YdiL (CAAX protease family)